LQAAEARLPVSAPAPLDTSILRRSVQMWNERILRDLAVFYGVTILPLDGFHLIFEPQFKLLQPDFF
jgi:hypothetical protein